MTVRCSDDTINGADGSHVVPEVGRTSKGDKCGVYDQVWETRAS